MVWQDKIKQALELPGKFLVNGGHAQQAIPSQHRLFNAAGMGAGWWVMDQMRHIVFGLKMKSEGEYEEVKREDVPEPLRFLHKTIDWDPLSDSPKDQWKKLVYELFPGMGAGAGAVLGSMYAFELNGRAQQFKANELKGWDKLKLLDADFAAQYAMSKPLRILSGIFGTFSAASGLTFLYGLTLNPAFSSAAGTRVFRGSLSKGNLAPHRAAEAEIGMIGAYIDEAVKTGKVSDVWAQKFFDRVLEPLFGHELKTPEDQAKAVGTLQSIVEESYQKYNQNGRPAKEITEAVTKDIKEKLGNSGIDETLKKRFGLDPKKANFGNANPMIRKFYEAIGSPGMLKGGPEKQTSSSALPLLGAAAGAGIIASTVGAKGKSTSADGSADSDNATATQHQSPDVSGKTAEQYAMEALALHKAQYQGQGTAPPDLLKWIGEAELAVFPQHRLDCAIGLTAGLASAGNLAAIATGYGLDKKPVDAAKIPTFLQGLKGVIKDFNPKGLRSRDRWITYAQWGIYSLGGLLGVRAGSEIAYKNVKVKNKNPHYLEDYLPRVSMHQGDNWSWLSSTSAMLASASGLWTVPIPGLNYGLSLAGRTTSMQDRNFMLGGGLNHMLSGASTTSFMRLREGVNYMCHYAAENPAKDPTDIEYLAYTVLEPLFKDQLKAEHIQRFTEAVHEVRDHYWQPGGIPKEKREEALAAMREVFTGPGLEVLLIDVGLNPGTIQFEKLNGMVGKIGNVGISNQIKGEQIAYQHALEEHLSTYVAQGMITQERADWVKEGIALTNRGEKQPALAPTTKEETPPSAEPEQSKKFTDKVKNNPLEELVTLSEKPGDWRDAARLSKEKLAPAAIGG